MQKNTVLILLPFLTVLLSCSGSKDSDNVPETVKAAFSTKFPGAKADWEKEGDKFEAGFIWEQQQMSAVFSANGTLEESETEMPPAKLTKGILDYINTNYPGKPVEEAARIVNADGSIQFEAAIKGMDVIFDANGNFVKEIKD